MATPELNLLVLRSADLEKSVSFYGLLGIVFDKEKHGSGPTHYSAQIGRTVLELYPLGEKDPTTDVRLGFTVSSVDDLVSQFEPEALSYGAKDTERGRLAVIIDPDGHMIELLES